MPKIKPISTSCVYSTRDGNREYGILTMAEIDGLDSYGATYNLFAKLQNAEDRAFHEGWIDATDAEKELMVFD